MTDEGKKFFDETVTWLNSLKGNLKGDTWEMEIMDHAITEVIHRVSDAEKPFLVKAK